MYEKYPWCGTHAHTHASRTYTHTHTRARSGSGRLAGINGLHSRRDCRDTLKSIVLMGFLSGPPLSAFNPARPTHEILSSGKAL